MEPVDDTHTRTRARTPTHTADGGAAAGGRAARGVGRTRQHDAGARSRTYTLAHTHTRARAHTHMLEVNYCDAPRATLGYASDGSGSNRGTLGPKCAQLIPKRSGGSGSSTSARSMTRSGPRAARCNGTRAHARKGARTRAHTRARTHRPELEPGEWRPYHTLVQINAASPRS